MVLTNCNMDNDSMVQGDTIAIKFGGAKNNIKKYSRETQCFKARASRRTRG